MLRTLQRWLQWLSTAIVRLAARVFLPRSPWERLKFRVPVTAFGLGSRRQFAQYFEGESRLHADSIDAIVEWLLKCEYASDPDLFNERDFWQHPSAFEELRRGDCEDFALWAWRKLTEIGIQAEFYVGRVMWGDDPEIVRQHAWVVYNVDGVPFLFEPAARNRQQMIRPLSEVRDQYVPHFAVNQQFRTSAFLGCLLDSRRDRDLRRERLPESRLTPSTAREKSCARFPARSARPSSPWRLE